MTRARAVLALALAACGRLGAAAPPAPPAPAAPPPDADTARADLSVMVRDSYRLLAQGYDNVYLDMLAHDPRLILIDVGPEELQVGFDEHAAGARRLFSGDDEYELWSKHLAISVSADHGSAWIHDDLSYRVQRGRRHATVPLRATSLFERRDGRWTKVLEHISIAQPVAEAAARAAPVATPFKDETAGEATGARVRETILASLATGSRVSADPDAFAIGVAAEQEHAGVDIAGAGVPGLVALCEVQSAVVTSMRVEIGRTGTVAWAAALVRLTTAAGQTFTARATWVLEKRLEDWRIVQTHVSAPLAEDILAADVFGDAK